MSRGKSSPRPAANTADASADRARTRPRHPLNGLLGGGRHLDRTRGLAILCGVDVNEVLLPGIGLRYEFTSASIHRFNSE